MVVFTRFSGNLVEFDGIWDGILDGILEELAKSVNITPSFSSVCGRCCYKPTKLGGAPLYHIFINHGTIQ